MPRDRTGQIFIVLASNNYSNTNGSSATFSYNQKDNLLWDLTVYSPIQVSEPPFHLFPVIPTLSLHKTANFR